MSGQVPASDIVPSLDALASAGGRWLWKSRLRDGLRSRLPRGLALLLLAPALALAVIGLGWLFGQPWKLPMVPLAVLWPVPSLIYLGFQWFRLGRIRPGRRAGLAVFDEALGLKDRLQTADEFLAAPRRTAFMEAAIGDAGPALELAEGNPPEWRWGCAPGEIRRWALLPALAVLLLVIAGFLPAASRAGSSPVLSGDGSPGGAGQLPVVATPNPPAPVSAVVESHAPRENRPQERVRKATAGEPAPDKSREDPSPELAGRDKISLGTSEGGQTSQAASSGRASESSGMPGSQAPSSAPEKQQPAKKKKAKQRDQKPSKADDKKSEETSGATAGRGSSGGSSENPASTDWASKDRTESADNEEFEQEEDVDDEDSESEARGGLQPNLRDRRPPVNRDLSIGFGNMASEDANGRGGPGDRKKSRGVAGLVLGVPIPDHVKGQPNPGRVKVTQERVQPQGEEMPGDAAEDRGQRNSPAGHLSERTLDQTMRDVVREYFLMARSREAAATSPEPSTD